MTQGIAARIRTAAYWLTPSLFCLIVYWYGFRAWYQMDDFAWLALPARVHDLPSFLAAMFQPLAQGTIRPWSERLFFFAGWHLFGTDANPLRAVVFLTQFANLILLTAITRQLTGSALAGLAAPLLWLCNSAVYEPLAWTSAWNQILCSWFLLLALWLWMQHTRTGDMRFLRWQWAVFLLGFGALEINVVYPAIAALYALCFAREYLARTVPMFAVSVAYAVFHRSIAPPQKTEIYRMYFDSSLFATLGTYVRNTFGIDRYAGTHKWPVWPHYAIEALVGTALLVFILIKMRQRQWLGVFGAAWFFITLAPILPLRNHISEYYLTIPAIGLALTGGWALGVAVRHSRTMTALAAILVLLYAVPSVWASRMMTREYYDISRRARTFFRSVAYADRLQQNKTLVIRNVDNDLFWAAWWDFPFQIFGRTKIFIAAESEPGIVPMSPAESVSRFFLSESETREGLRAGSVAAYEVLEGGRLRNVSAVYLAMLEHDPALAFPKYVDLGRQLSAVHLREGWWDPEGNHRWTAANASLIMRGPASQGGELVLTGRCPAQHMAKGPLHFTVGVDGIRFARSTITESNLDFSFRYSLPAQLSRKASITISIDVDRTLQVSGDKRDLGLALATVEIVR